MKRSICLILTVLLMTTVMLTAAWADEPGVVTTLDENGNPVTEIVDESGNKMTIEVVDEGMQEELDIDWIEAEENMPETGPDDPGDQVEPGDDSAADPGGAPDGGAAPDPNGDAGVGDAPGGGLAPRTNAMGEPGEDGAAAPTPAAKDKDREKDSAPLVEQIKEVLPEAVQELVTPDENGQTAISDSTLILILVILLVLLLVIVAGIVLLIVLVISKSRKQNAKSGTEKEETPKTEPADRE